MNTPSRSQKFFCKSHPDFHIPADVAVGEGFDGHAYARKMKECHCDATVFFGKCHYGHAYYPTTIGTPHPLLKKDMLKDFVEGCRANDLGAIVYYSVFLDTAAVVNHPDWRIQAVSEEMNMGFSSNNFQRVCVSSPYCDELLIPQSIEIATKYDVDELFYDTMTGFNPCFCQYCRQQFGEDIPTSDQDPRWLKYVAWYARQYENFFARVTKAIYDVRPEVGVTFNWAWSYQGPSPRPPHIARITADLISTGRISSLFCRDAAGSGLPYDYMTGRFMHGLNEWNNKSMPSLKYTAATTIGNGASFYLIDRQLPDGSLEERGWNAMQEVFGWVQERRDTLLGAQYVPEIAVLNDWASFVGPNLEYFPNVADRKKRIAPIAGVADCLIENHRHFTILHADTLASQIGDYRLLIVPEQEYLSDSIKQTIQQFAEKGGHVLYTQSSREATVDSSFLQWAGVQYQSITSLEYSFFDAPEPLLIQRPFANVTAAPGTEVLLKRRDPATGGNGGKKYGHGFPPPGELNAFAGATLKKIGKGSILYVPAPLFEYFFTNFNPLAGDLLLTFIDRLLPNPLVRVTHPAQIEMAVLKKGKKLVVTLMNHSAKEKLSGYWQPIHTYMPEIRDIPVALRLDSRKTLSIRSIPDRQALPVKIENGYAHITVPSLEYLATLEVEDYFA